MHSVAQWLRQALGADERLLSAVLSRAPQYLCCDPAGTPQRTLGYLQSEVRLSLEDLRGVVRRFPRCAAF
jgi:hypothetical protein